MRGDAQDQDESLFWQDKNTCCDMDSLVVGWRVGPDEKDALREDYDEKKCFGGGKFNCIQTQRVYFGTPIS